MVSICVICTIKEPPLLPLSAEYRQLLEAVISPVINTSEFKGATLLQCVDCRVLMKSVYAFQQMAVKGVKNFTKLLSRVNDDNTATGNINPIPEAEIEHVSIKIEPEYDRLEIPSKQEVQSISSPNSSIKSEPEDDILDIPTIHHKVASISTPTVPLIKIPKKAIIKVTMLQPILKPNPAPSKQAVAMNAAKVLNPRTLQQNFKDEETRKLMEMEYELANAPTKSENGPPTELPSGVPGAQCARRKRKRPKKPSERVSCPHCDKSLSCKENLRIHIRGIHEPEPVPCKTCGELCRSKASLAYHMKKHIQATKTIEDLNPDLFCVECGIPFYTPGEYKLHRLTLKHTPREQYTFQCDICKKKFPTKYGVQKHIDRVHLGNKQCKCNICGIALPRRSSLLRHLVSVHGKPERKHHICHYCGKNFTIQKTLTEHLSVHEGLRPFKCKVCPATFSYSAALYTHNKLKHLKIKGKWKKKNKGKEGIEGKVKRTEKEVAEKEVNREMDVADTPDVDSFFNKNM